jgi:hypothetical protein
MESFVWTNAVINVFYLCAGLAALGAFGLIAEPRELEGALYRALDQYRELNGAGIDQETLARDFAALKQADADGSLERQYPGLKQYFAEIESSSP